SAMPLKAKKKVLLLLMLILYTSCSQMSAQLHAPVTVNPNSGQFQYDYSQGNSYGASYGEDDLKDSDWLDRQDRKNG
ncbi:hypothetical protein DPMN_030383, partial [Dreissena polymorpha]